MARMELLNFSLSIKVGLVGYFSTAHFSVSVIGPARGGLSFHPIQCMYVSWCLLRFVMEKLVMVVHLRASESTQGNGNGATKHACTVVVQVWSQEENVDNASLSHT